LLHDRAGSSACRPNCGACCIAPSISSPISGVPNGKPAGMRCVQLDKTNLFRIFGSPKRPAIYAGLQPAVGDVRRLTGPCNALSDTAGEIDRRVESLVYRFKF